MLEMMEEFDFEDEILSIHPDEDIRKIEAIEIDTNSNLEPASDSDIIKIEAIETDTNSNLELASDPDIGKIEAIETDTNSNLEQASDSDIRKIEIDTNSNLEPALDLDSDSGEIDDDEEANDLEEGEIKDISPVSKKKSDIACRFFKRGSCVYGSQCQYLHVSDTVYKMFDTNPQKRKDMPLVEHHSFPKPLIFPPIVLPPRPFIEPPISVAPKTDFHRQCDKFEDTWEKGLEQARILIRKANLKKKNEECEQKKIDSKNNNKDEKIKGQYFTKADLGNELDFNNKKYCEKNSTNSSFRKENSYDEKKSNYRYQPKSSDKWVDPWRRSKSPLIRKRPRSLSGSPPSHSRKHSSTSSTSSVSSSSSEFDDIYRKPYEKKSPRGQQKFKSRSRSVSQSRRPKKRKISPKHSFNGRRNPRSDSRSLSMSPFRKRTFSSRTQSRSSSSSSSSSSSCSDCQSPTVEDKEMKKISAKLDEQISQKSPKRSSELLDSDCETSEMTVSSASCTSLSSESEAESLHHRSSLKSKRSPNRNNASSYSNKTTSLSNPKVSNRNRSNLLKNHYLMQRKNDIVPAYQRKMQPPDNRKNLNNWNFKTEAIDCKPKNTGSYFSSVKKPASAPKFSENKMSGDMELLSAYQRKTEATDCKPKNTASFFSSVKKPASAPKVSENKMSGDMEWLSAYQRKMQPSDNSKNLNNWSFKTDATDCKPKNTASFFSSVKKPASAPKCSEDKLSGDMELLFMYQGLGSSNKNSSNVQKVKSNNPTSKPNKTKDAVNVTNKANSNSQSYDNVAKVGNASKKDIVLNLQPKCKDYFKPELFNRTQDLDEIVTIKKETASKREQLLNKLKLIDDAIARKKSK
ncbi:hypothetical protein AVEN_121032-1 [Araneus ventricosus]|uniref:C3H1-type domain-containing protein n=1 Tax=Araneus ventricosus TaxID=182803 RepID=A0A4Y2F5H0_ARAVE|nr:hypothetical protein AVEN_121032-1 [Araneus ventricosus]